jgi:hypothetical protein
MRPDAHDGVASCLQSCGDDKEANNDDFLHGAALWLIRRRGILPPEDKGEPLL